jgi:flagellar biosynthesis/type III secretory pathway M-ring protein FliF/YscJ
VKSSLGIQENDPTRKDELTLEETPFNDQTATEITQQFEEQNKRQVWFDLAQKLMYPALALGIIFMFWRMVKNTKVEEIPLGVPIGNGNGNGNGHYGAPGAPGSRMVTVDVLNQLIRENPANMTQAVRTWMNRAKPNN